MEENTALATIPDTPESQDQEKDFMNPPATEEVVAEKDEVEETAASESAPVAEQAIEKLNQELAGKDVSQEKRAIIQHLITRCGDDEGLSQDVMQEHKTYEKCYKFIEKKAREKAKDGCAMIEDRQVYEWAEDYYHVDDAAEEAKKKAEEEERRKKNEERAKQQKEEQKKKRAEAKAKKADSRKKSEDSEKAPASADSVEQETKPKDKKGKDVDGQMSMFDLM